MTETEVAPPAATKPRGGGLSAMLLPELKQLAQQLGIPGASGMRKGDLVAAIGDRQRGSAPASGSSTPPAAPTAERPRRSAPVSYTHLTLPTNREV